MTQISQNQSLESQSATEARAVKTDVEKEQIELDQLWLGLEVKSESDIAEVLSLSMPKNAKYPDVFYAALAALPYEALFAIVCRPEGAHARFIAELQSQNRKAWSRMGRDQRNGDDEATREATRLRRRWFADQLAKVCEVNERVVLFMHRRPHML